MSSNPVPEVSPTVNRTYSMTDMAIAKLSDKVDDLSAKIDAQQKTLDLILKDHESRLRRVEIFMFILPFVIVIVGLLIWTLKA